jgi:hypothetical protein
LRQVLQSATPDIGVLLSVCVLKSVGDSSPFSNAIATLLQSTEVSDLRLGLFALYHAGEAAIPFMDKVRRIMVADFSINYYRQQLLYRFADL